MFVRNCPDCGEEMSYSSKGNLTKAIKKGVVCKSCTQKGIVRGRPSEQHRKNISLARGGSGNLDQKYPGWKAWTKRALDRVPFCEWCYSEDNLQVHHIMPKAKFPMYHDEDWNARVMCKQCHITCHKQGGY